MIIAAGARKASSPRTCLILQACWFYTGLRETPDSDPRQRTEWNVRDSDKLLVLVDGAGLALSKGTVFAVHCAETLGKPYVVIGLDDEDAGARAAAFLGEGQAPLALNIAGPRDLARAAGEQGLSSPASL